MVIYSLYSCIFQNKHTKSKNLCMTFKIYPYFCSRKRIIIQWRTRIADLIQSKWLSPAKRLEVRTNSCRSWQKKDSTDTSHPVARLEATEGSQSCQHERELCICTTQQYHVQAHDRTAKGQRNAASQRLHLHWILPQHRCHQDSSGICQQHGIRHWHAQFPWNHRYHCRRWHHHAGDSRKLHANRSQACTCQHYPEYKPTLTDKNKKWNLLNKLM